MEISDLLRARLRAVSAHRRHLLRTFDLIWHASRGWTLAWVGLLVIQGLLPAVVILLARQLVDRFTPALQAHGSWDSIEPVVFLAGAMAGVLVISEILHGLASWVRMTQAELVRDYLSALIHKKAVEVDLAFYESPAYHDLLERVRGDLNTRPLALLEQGGSFLQNALTLLSLSAILIPYGVWLPFVLGIGAVPAFCVGLYWNKRQHRWWERTTVDRRQAQYYETLLTFSAVAAEIRLFDLGSYFRAAHQRVRHQLRSERLAMIRTQGLVQASARLVGVVVAGLVMAWMGWRALLGAVTLGDIVLFHQTFSRGQGVFGSLFENVSQVYTNTLFLGSLFEFLQLESHVVDPPHPVPVPLVLRQGICFEQVTFRYPHSERPVLRDFTLRLPAGRIAAIVGANGAGKSTLIKLLCRFYDPELGRVTLDGVDIRSFSVEDLRRMFTVLFQQPVPYQTTAAQNIAFGNWATQPSKAELEAAARSAGVHDIIARLPQGYETLLGKWFAHGVELSNGEWQRLALARAFLRQAPIIILDEPTSALDPWAEIDWFERFRALAQGRTSLVVTHRFTVARQADLIYVVNDGAIVECGTHEELLAQNGRYAQSWAAQVHASSDSSQLRVFPEGRTSARDGTPEHQPHSIPLTAV